MSLSMDAVKSTRSVVIGGMLLFPILFASGCASGSKMNWGLGRASSKLADDEAIASNEQSTDKTKKKSSFLPFGKKSTPAESVEDTNATATDPQLVHADVVNDQQAAPSDDDESNEKSGVRTADAVIDPNDPRDASINSIETIGGTTPSRGAKRGVTHDAELLKRINTELSDLPQKERAELFHNLKTLDPAMVDQILKIRRMSRSISQTVPPESTKPNDPVGGHTSKDDTRATPLPVLGNDLAMTENPQQRSGLGEGDPWGTQKPPARQETLVLGESKPIGPPPRQLAQLPVINPSGSVNQADQVTPSEPERIDRDTLTQNEEANHPVIDLTANDAAGSAAKNDSPISIFPPEETRSARVLVAEQFPEGTSTGSRTASGASSLEQLIANTEAQISKMPLGTTVEEQQRFVEQHVYLRLLYWMNKQQERALQPIPGIDAADQEFWQQLFWAMSNYFDYRTIPDDSDRAAQTLDQLRAAVQRLREKAKLEIHNVAFCHKITSFGNYDRFNNDEFTPGQPVLLYGEMVNFRSEPTADGQYRTILKSTLEIYRAGPRGELVERIPFQATEDLCRQPRTDYFHSYQFTIPKRITLGPHVLKLVVEDQLSQKMATYTINFMVK